MQNRIRGHEKKRRVVTGLVVSICLLGGEACGADSTLRNEQFEVTLLEEGAIEVATKGGARRTFQPQFTVLIAEKDPGLTLRWAQFPEDQVGGNANKQAGQGNLLYNVVTWGRKSVPTAVDAAMHVEDGFDPTVDRAYGEGRTANTFHAAPRATMIASSAVLKNNAIHWRFEDHPKYTLRATVELPPGAALPVLHWELETLADGFYSVGYTGAPQIDPVEAEAIWQPMIWNELRFPDQPYLTQAFRCPLPTTLVTSAGVTTGVLADPSEFPFTPMPTSKNSLFGVTVRNDVGNAQPALFAPVLGGSGSKRKAGAKCEFTVQLVVHPSDSIDTFEYLARKSYQFHDSRSNAICSLNTTLENMVDYGMSEWSRFNEELRGCDYSTDAPGAVKNVSSLHPLSVALVTDNWEILKRRAWPMFEYALSRERFLFTTNPEQKTQGASTKMTGPGVPLSELTSLYIMSGRQAALFLTSAKRMYGQNKVFNLEAVTQGDRWQNALALYRATGEDKWRQRTIELADAYLERRCSALPSDWSDPDSEGMFFWTSYVPQWIELLELHETIPKQRYLDAAHAGARAYTQFIWFCPVIPDGTVHVNDDGKAPRYRTGDRFEDIYLSPEVVPAWRVSEIGLTPESSATCKGHRAIFNAHYAPSMMRLSRLTGDKFLHDVARSAIIGRYASFPGYHMNTARTTVYEKPDFALRPVEQLNAVTSMHFNHIWPHAALILEYMVSDVYARSGGEIDFPSAYCEGYAYLQGKVFGHAPGHFYKDEGVWLWMPKDLLDVENVEVNYLAGRGNGNLYLAFTNQSSEPVTTTVQLNEDLAPLEGRHDAQVRRDNRSATTEDFENGNFEVKLSPNGITTIKIRDVEVQPSFQNRLSRAEGRGEPVWKAAYNQQEVAGLTGMVLSMGPELSSAYVYSRAPLDEFEQIDLHYRIDDGDWEIVSDDTYPFEWTAPLPGTAKRFEYYAEAKEHSGLTRRASSVVFEQ